MMLHMMILRKENVAMKDRKALPYPGLARKTICLVFALLMLVAEPTTTLPANATDADVADSIEAQIRAYADSIDQPGADRSAAMELASHGMLGNGKTLNMGASSPLTATLLNSEVVQEGFAVIFADTIQAMQRLDMQSAPGVGMNFNWYGAETDYCGYIFTDAQEYPDNLDWAVTNEQYTGSQNAYDNALEWMVGGCEVTAVIECIEDHDSVKTYKVTATFSDRFDFSTANTSGFKKLLSGIGMRLFREFNWNCTITLNITAPYSYEHCSHDSGAYHWTYDGENYSMTSDSSGAYLKNNATHRSNTVSDGTIHHYYELDNTVRLRHDRPWVLEYDTSKPRRIVFAPVDNAVTKTHPQIVQSAGDSVFAVSKDYAMAKDPEGNLDRYYAFNYYGTKLADLFQPSYGKTYTYRLENVISGDGNNRIYLTVIETETGECCLDRVPMDDYYYFGGWMDQTAFISEENNWLSGKDIHINYFGTGTQGFKTGTFDLRIWENGKDGGVESYFVSKVTDPTCESGGYTTHTCSRCGYSYQSDYLEAADHSFGDWVRTVAPACTEQGEESRTCTICGKSQTRSVAALGHDILRQPGQAATCTEDGWLDYETCTRCDYSNYQAVGAAGHSYSAAATAPTCTEQGYTTYTCHCGDSYISDHVDAAGHSFGDWYAEREPTCTGMGSERRDCAHCDHAEIRETAPTGHDYSSAVTEPTCTIKGCTTYTCALCGDSYTEDYVPAPGHSYGPWEEVKPPTVQESGLSERTCCVCGNKDQKELDKLEPPATEPAPTAEPTTPATQPSEAPEAPKEDPAPMAWITVAAVLAVLGAGILLVLFKRKR